MDNDKPTLRYPNVLYTGTKELTLEEQEEINAMDAVVYGAFFKAFAKIKDPTITFSDKHSGPIFETYEAPLMTDELAAEVLKLLREK